MIAIVFGEASRGNPIGNKAGYISVLHQIMNEITEMVKYETVYLFEYILLIKTTENDWLFDSLNIFHSNCQNNLNTYYCINTRVTRY